MKRLPGGAVIGGGDNINMIYVFGLNSSGSDSRQVGDFCDQGNYSLGPIKAVNLLTRCANISVLRRDILH